MNYSKLLLYNIKQHGRLNINTLPLPPMLELVNCTFDNDF